MYNPEEKINGWNNPLQDLATDFRLNVFNGKYIAIFTEEQLKEVSQLINKGAQV